MGIAPWVILLEEMIISTNRDLIRRCSIVPYGTANVGFALGQMVDQNRFRRPTIVYLDADQEPSRGCELLPGDDAPERVVFNALTSLRWNGVAARVSRSPGETIDALDCAMTKSHHHDWIGDAADRLVVGKNELWRALCSVWVATVATAHEKDAVVQRIEDRIEGTGRSKNPPQATVADVPSEPHPVYHTTVQKAASPASPGKFSQNQRDLFGDES